jgi:hypothetical protein
MKLEVWRTVLLVICFFAVAARAQNPDLSGKWQVSIMHRGQPRCCACSGAFPYPAALNGGGSYEHALPSQAPAPDPKNRDWQDG